jgi:hypothetical protein
MRRFLFSLFIAVLLAASPTEAQLQTSGTGFQPGGGGGSQTKIATVVTTAAQAAMQFTALGTYNNLRLVCSNIVISASAYVILQFGTGGGPSYDATAAHYTWSATLMPDGSTFTTESQTALSQLGIGVLGFPTSLPAGGAPGSFDMTIYGVAGVLTKNVTYQGFSYWTTLANIAAAGGGSWLQTTPATALQILPGTGTFSAGATCTLYGLTT